MSKLAHQGDKRIIRALQELHPAAIKETTRLAEHMLASRKEGEDSLSAVVMGKFRADLLHALTENHFPKDMVRLKDLGANLYKVTVNDDSGYPF